MIEKLSHLPKGTVAFAAHGRVTGEDYEKILIPAIEDELKHHDKLRLYYQVEDDVSYSASAVWDDAKFGLTHLRAFEKIAIVTNVKWMSESVRFFKFLVPCPVRTFPTMESGDAKAWLATA